MKNYFKSFLKLLFFYIVIKVILLFFQWIFTKEIFGILNLENLAASDLSLNDLYYQYRDPPSLSNEIILVNTGSLSETSFRFELSETIKKIDNYNPKVIAIDHIFSMDTSRFGSTDLVNTFQQTKNLIIPESVVDIAFPSKQHTIRKYFWNHNTFAFQIAKKINPVIKDQEILSDNFLIKYFTTKYEPPTLPVEWQIEPSFIMIEANVLLNQENHSYKDYFENKAVLMGHLGRSCIPHHFDLEDKFPVPADKDLVNRQKSTAGLLIHANAVENLLNPKEMFLNIHDSIWFTLIEELLLILYLSFLIFVRVGKILNVIILLALSLPAIFLVIVLMEKNIYFEIGATLIQFLLFEELVEVIESMNERVKKVFKINIG